MKGIENEVKSMKAEYGDKINPQLRQRLDKYLLIFRELAKTPSTKVRSNHPLKMVSNLQTQMQHLRRQIQADIKLSLTDLQAFLWKTEQLKQGSRPAFFSELKFSSSEPPCSLYQIKNDFNFPILKLRTKDMIQIGSTLILENQFCSENYDEKFLSRLLRKISEKYNILAYHNYSHAFSVFLMLFQCREKSTVFQKIYSDFQFFIAYIAALCHDMNHRGTNSGYEIKKKTDLAARYSNASVLQNMHISHFYQMNKENPDLDILNRIKSPAQKIAAKRLFNQLILATDIIKHNQHLTKLKQIKGEKIDELNPNQKQIILQNIFHACDIGNPALEFDNYMNWSLLLAHQFNAQAELEKSQGLQVTPNFTFKNMSAHYRGQIGFIDYLALPLWKQISQIFPELALLSESMSKNKKLLEIGIDKFR